MNKVSCELCGGTEYHKESGYYYCKECQTQSQDIRELVFNEEDAFNQTKSRRIRKPKEKQQAKEQITSWECYNYVMLGLVNELINLGADESLKETVQILWLKYLRKIEAVHEDNTQPPKLQAFNSKKDAAIVYGRIPKKVKRKRKRSDSESSNTDVASLDPHSIRRLRGLKKRAYVKAFTDEYASTIKSDSSVHNQSLSSMRTSNENSLKAAGACLQYNKNAENELRKIMTKNHLTKHIKDLHAELNCHNLRQKSFSKTYITGPDILTRSKIYAILYLGLLINKDKIQLGDMLRFIHEGHLSYNYVNHFFPENFENKILNFGSFAKNTMIFTHESLRMTAAKVACYIDVKRYIPIQNLVHLCELYCKELNLPDSIGKFATNLISRTSPKMKIWDKIIPNYEGRAMSYIIFTIKLIFGLDNTSEFNFSTLSDLINQHLNENMFNFKDWLIFIEYRKLILTQCHFPTQFCNRIYKTDTYTNFIQEYYKKHEREKPKNLEYEVLERLLNKLSDINNKVRFNFMPTLTPMKDYIELIINSSYLEENQLLDIIKANFHDTSLDYLLKSKHYFDILNLKVTYHNKGANDNIKLINMFKCKLKYDKRVEPFIPVKFDEFKTKTKKNKNKLNSFNNIKQSCIQIDTEFMLSTFQLRNESKFKLNYKRLQSLCQRNSKLSTRKEPKDNEDVLEYHHYQPDERFWLLNCKNLTTFKKYDYDSYYQLFPYHFKLILNECARITQQTMHPMLDEYCNLELYMCYNFDGKKEIPTKFFGDNSNLENMLNKIDEIW